VTAFVLLRLAEIAAIVLFILGLHFLSSPATARFGNRLAAIGMLIAIIAVLAPSHGYGWWAILVGVVVGTAVGLYSALKVKMTAMPQMVALFNGAGGGAAAAVSTAQYLLWERSHMAGVPLDVLTDVAPVISAIIGAVSASGSIIAFLKLQELMTGRPIT